MNWENLWHISSAFFSGCPWQARRHRAERQEDQAGGAEEAPWIVQQVQVKVAKEVTHKVEVTTIKVKFNFLLNIVAFLLPNCCINIKLSFQVSLRRPSARRRRPQRLSLSHPPLSLQGQGRLARQEEQRRRQVGAEQELFMFFFVGKVWRQFEKVF